MPRMNRKPGEKAKDFKGTLKKLIKYAGRYRIGIIAVMICAIASARFPEQAVLILVILEKYLL